MESLSPVTQLYVSVDAGNKESMRAVDRPLFKDFWERFLSCLDILGRKVCAYPGGMEEGGGSSVALRWPHASP
jgi:wyosine [tRNA(Phe)-imidazoG37] synthetase (radical SAM superfamily)